MDGSSTPIAVFSLGLGGVLGSAMAGVDAAVTGVQAAIPAATGLVEGAQTLATVAPPLIETASQGVNTALTIGPELVKAATQLGTTAEMLAGGVPQLAEGGAALAQGGAQIASQGSSLAQVVSQGAQWQPWQASSLLEGAPQSGNTLMQGVSSATDVASRASELASTGPQGLTDAQIWSEVTQQMTPTNFGVMEALPGAEPIAPFTGTGWGSTPLGVTGSGGTTLPSSTAAAETPWYKSEFVQKFGKDLSGKLMKQGMSGLDMGGGGQGQQQPAAQPAPPTPSPPHDPYRSQHVAYQRDYAQSIMEQYLSGGGYG